MRSLIRQVVNRLVKLLLVAICAAGASTANAQLTFNLTTGNNTTSLQKVAMDSNQCPNQGPTAAYTGGLVTNSGATTITNISASLSGLTNGFSLGGGQAPSQFLGSLAPGQSIAVYWLTSYGCTDQASATALITMSASAGTTLHSYTLRTQQSKSANAGGRVTTSTLGPGAVVGQIIELDVSYDFGGNAAGDEFLLQPSGSTAFNAACFKLVKTQVLTSNIAGITVGQFNKLYFVQPTQQPGNNYVASIRYSFQYLCANASTVARPYAAQTSGTQLKYTGNFDGVGSIQITYPGATNSFTITKSVTPETLTIGGPTLATYTVTVTNPSPYASFVSSIVDVLPNGATFNAIALGSDVMPTNSSSIPATGAAGTLTFQGKPGQTYSIVGGASVVLKYTANIPPTNGDYTNAARAVFGAAQTPTATAIVKVRPTSLAVTKANSIYSDPANGLSNPKAIPGSIIEYVISVKNTNSISLDAGSVLITDVLPPDMKLRVADYGDLGSGPIGYSDDSPGLNYIYTSLASQSDNLSFSADGGITWAYAPVPDVNGFDSSVTHFRVRPSGTMAAEETITLNLRAQVK